MTLLTQNLSKLVFAKAIRVVTLVVMVVVFVTSAALGSFAYVTPDEQVSFTATATAVITGVTKLPGGLGGFHWAVDPHSG